MHHGFGHAGEQLRRLRFLRQVMLAVGTPETLDQSRIANLRIERSDRLGQAEADDALIRVSSRSGRAVSRAAAFIESTMRAIESTRVPSQSNTSNA